MARRYIGECSLTNQLWYISHFLSLVGINIFDGKWLTGWRIVKEVFLLTTCIVVFTYLVTGFLVSSLANYGRSFYDVIIPLFYLTHPTVDILQFCWIIYYRKNLVEYIKLAKDEIQEHITEEEMEAYSESMRRNKLLSLLSVILTFMSDLGFLLFLPFDKEMGYQMMGFIAVGLQPTNESPNYAIVRVYNMILTYLLFSIRSGCLMLYITLLGHCISQYRVLSSRIEHVVKLMLDTDEKDTVFDLMKSIVDSHCLIILMISKLNCMYMFILATDVLLTMASIGLALLLRGSFLLCLIAEALLSLFLFTFISEMLNTERERFFDSIYMADWYLITPSYRKDLSFIMLMASKPSYLTVAKLTTLSLKTFQSALNFTYSTYAIIRSKSV